MDYYKKGKALLDAFLLHNAREAFQQGLRWGDKRCAYGMLAAAAMEGTSMEEPLVLMETVIGEIRDKADQGDSDCCFILGRCYETGSAVQQDIPLAMKYYTKAAGYGNPDAMYNLGCIFISMGKGGRALAKDYFTEASNAGCKQAEAALAYMEKEDSAL